MFPPFYKTLKFSLGHREELHYNVVSVAVLYPLVLVPDYAAYQEAEQSQQTILRATCLCIHYKMVLRMLSGAATAMVNSN